MSLKKSAAQQGATDNPNDIPDDTPEYPLSAPMKPDDPERRSQQSRAETEGLIEEEEEEEEDDGPSGQT